MECWSVERMVETSAAASWVRLGKLFVIREVLERRGAVFLERGANGLEFAFVGHEVAHQWYRGHLRDVTRLRVWRAGAHGQRFELAAAAPSRLSRPHDTP